MPNMILVVANRTPSTPMLIDEVARRAHDGASFTLLVPADHGGSDHVDWSQEDAQRLLSRAAGADVVCLDAGGNSLDTIKRAVDDGACHEIIVSTAPEHLAGWLHHDLPHRVEHLGLPVTVIGPELDVPDDIREGLPTGWSYPPVEGF